MEELELEKKIKLDFPLNVCSYDTGSVFSVPHQVAEIFIAEEKIVGLVNRSSSAHEVDIYLESWSSRLRELSSDYYDDVLQRLVGNPVHVFNLMERLVILLPKIVEGLPEPEQVEIAASLRALSSQPDETDVEGAMQALIRVQFAYK